ncbi:MAG: response regulator transcription factor [Methylobacterium mesophilicum]|nr:response regulator transcription factor [Methylobacterium mesophilicum]
MAAARHAAPIHLFSSDVTKDMGGRETAIRPDRSLVIIDPRALDRECLAQSMASRGFKLKILHYSSMEEWKLDKDFNPPLSAILLNIGGRKVSEAATENEIRKVSAEFAPVPVILLADTDDLAQILTALEYGARGYIPSSVGVEVCIEAIGLAMAGGTFVPASSVFAMRKLIPNGGEPARPLSGMFTLRQAEVVEALRRGKANKIIAYELNLRESTVKVHIRNIMKKLKATNRTEVAFKINDLFPMN